MKTQDATLLDAELKQYTDSIKQSEGFLSRSKPNCGGITQLHRPATTIPLTLICYFEKMCGTTPGMAILEGDFNFCHFFTFQEGFVLGLRGGTVEFCRFSSDLVYAYPSWVQ